ncbi:MAG: hypothetical protein AAGI38_01115 [Bacteroidota bacterium]
MSCLLMLGGCKGEALDPLANAPTLWIEQVYPDTVRQFQDSITLILGYEDPNGDLGSIDPNDRTLWVKDSRLPEGDLYHVKPIVPTGDEIHIRGTIRIGIRPPFLLGSAGLERIVLSAKIRDQEGVWSEEVSAFPIWVIE